VDLGVDVPSSAFVDKIKQVEPQVLGLSALLTAAVTQAEATMADIKKSGLRDKIKIIIGGGVVGEINASDFGVDFATINASEGIRVIEDWIAKQKKGA